MSLQRHCLPSFKGYEDWGRTPLPEKNANTVAIFTEDQNDLS